MYRHSCALSFLDTRRVCLILLLFTNVIAQDTVSVLKDTSRILLCEHGLSAIGSFTWKKGGSVIMQGFIANGRMTIAMSMPDRTELLLQNGSPNMRLDNIDISDEGTYSCEASEQGTGTLTVLTSELLVRVQPTAGPDVQVQYDPQPADMSNVPLNTTVTFTCTSTGGRPPATLGWVVTESGTVVSVNPTYTSSNNSQVVGDATSTFNFATTKYGVTYRAECVASGPSPIQDRRSPVTSFTTEPEPTASTMITTTIQIGLTGAPCSGPGVVAGAAVGCFICGLLVGGAAVFLFLHFRTAKNGGSKKEVDADRRYENVSPSRAVSQRAETASGSDEYEVPMKTIQPRPQPPQSNSDYQELRPAIYQSLQKK